MQIKRRFVCNSNNKNIFITQKMSLFFVIYIYLLFTFFHSDYFDFL